MLMTELYTTVVNYGLKDLKLSERLKGKALKKYNLFKCYSIKNIYIHNELNIVIFIIL